MATKSMQYGELTLAFTTDLKFRWNSEKTDAKYKGAFYHPVPPAGFYALGSVATDHFGDDGNIAALCVKGTVGSGSDGAPLARPTSYERMWHSKGMGGKYSGSCWRPVAPRGYVALGHVFGSDRETMPSTSDIVCVRQDLAYKGEVGEFIYSTMNSDANNNFSAWAVAVPAFDGEDTGLIAGLTFIGHPSQQTAPTDDTALWVLNLPFPAESFASPQTPTLTGYTDPGEYTSPVTDRIVYVPFTAIVDTEPVTATGEDISVGWQVDNTPFYSVRRLASYHRIIHFYNQNQTQQTSPSKTTTMGVSEDTSQTYTVETGIEVGFEAGVSVGAEAKVSAKVSLALGFSQTVAVGEFKEESMTYSIDVAPQTSGVLYVTSYTLHLYRADGTEVGNGLTLDVDSYYATQYPAPSSSVQAMSVMAVQAEPEEAAVPA